MHPNSQFIKTIFCICFLVCFSAAVFADETDTPGPTPTQTIQEIEPPEEIPTLATSDFVESPPETPPEPEPSPDPTPEETVEPSGSDSPTPDPSLSQTSDAEEEPTQIESGLGVEPPASDSPISTDYHTPDESIESTASVTPTPTLSPTETPTLAVSDFSPVNSTPPGEDDAISDSNTSVSSEEINPPVTGEEESTLMAVVIPKTSEGEKASSPEGMTQTGAGGTYTLGEVVVSSLPPGSTPLEEGISGSAYIFTGTYDNGVIEILQSGSYHLTDDLTSSLPEGTPGSHTFAIKISAPDVVLDGNGKTVTVSSSSMYADAIQINGSGNTVQNFGEIEASTNTGCYGIYVNRTSYAGEDAIIQNNIITGGVDGIRAGGTVGKNLGIINNTISGYSSAGIYINSSGLVSGNTITGKGGINLQSSDDMTITGNNVTIISSGTGISNTGTPTNLTISQNQIRNAGTGISMNTNSRGTISSNTVTNGNTGISGGQMDIAGNTISGMTTYGIAQPLNNYHPVTISDNTITGSGTGIMLYSNSTLTGNTISGNNLGLEISTSEYQNTYVYNNLFSNANNAYGQLQSGSISWTNPSGPTPGTNVIGGPNIAGNYWGNQSGTGYSDLLTPDTRGYNTTPYMVVSGTYDTAPLVKTPSPTPTPAPTATGTSVTDDDSEDVPVPATQASDTRPGVHISITEIGFTTDAAPGLISDLVLVLGNTGSDKPLAGATIMLKPVNEQALPVGSQTGVVENGTYHLTIPLPVPSAPGTYVFRFSPIQVIHKPKTGEPIEIPAGEVVQFTVVVGEDGTVTVTSP